MQPREDVVEDVDQRLEDVGFEEHDRGVLRQIGSVGSTRPRSLWRPLMSAPASRARSERVRCPGRACRSESSSTPPWLKGLQRSRRQPARIEPADRARARESPGRRSPSRSGSSGIGARRPARSSADRARIGAISRAARNRFTTNAPRRSLSTQLGQRGAKPLRALALEQSLDARAGDDHVVVARLEAVGELPERLPDRPLHLVPGHGLADLPADREAEPGAVARTRPRGGRRSRGPGSGCHASCPRGRRDRSRRSGRVGADGRPGGPRRPTSGREPLAALLTPAPQDRAAGAGTAPRPETMGPGSLALLRLIGPLHQESPGREGRGHGSIGRRLCAAENRPLGFRRVLHGGRRRAPFGAGGPSL